MKKLYELIPVTSVIIAIGATAAFALGVLDMNLYVMILGLGGFAGLAGLRAAIASSGYKTLIVAASGAVVAVGVGFGIVPPDNAAIIYAILGIGSLPTLGHAIKKTSTGGQ